jgi:hypothetical protein
MSFLRHHRNVRLIYLAINIPSSLVDRLVRHQDIPPECLEYGGDLREHSKKGLEAFIWRWSYSRYRQVPTYLPESGLGARRGGWQAAAGEL